MRRKSARYRVISAGLVAAAIACGPSAPAQAPQPPIAAALPAPATPPPAPEPGQPGYTGNWAAAAQDCTDATKALHLGGDVIDIRSDKRSCGATSLQEEHPTGRSAIFRIEADCEGENGETKHVVTLTFGAADTVMEMLVDDGPAQRLERCPA